MIVKRYSRMQRVCAVLCKSTSMTAILVIRSLVYLSSGQDTVTRHAHLTG